MRLTYALTALPAGRRVERRPAEMREPSYSER
jgi:hypothetical protein